MTSRGPRSLNRLRPLSLAIAATWACSAPVLAQSLGPVVADGHQLDVISGSYASSDDGVAGHVFHALNGGSIGSGGPVSLNVIGANTAGARAETSGTLVFAAVEITTSGASALGLSVATGGRIELREDASGQGTRVTTRGLRSTAAQIDAGTLVMRNATLETTGDGSYGLLATADAQVDMVGGRIQTSGNQSHAVMANNGVVTVRDAQIQTGGSSSDNMYALNGGHIEGDNLDLSTVANGSSGARVHVGSAVSLSNSRIRTEGDLARGITGGGSVTLLYTDVHTSGSQSTAVELSGGTLRIHDSSVRADHERSDGVFLWANNQVDITSTTITAGHYGININGDGSEVRLSDVDITTNGFIGTGIWLPSNSTLHMLRGSITTQSDFGLGIDNRDGVATLDGLKMVTAGGAAHGLYASMDSGSKQPIFHVDRVDVTTTGAGSIGAIARLGGTVHLRDSTLLTTGTKGYGVLSGGPGELTLHNTHVRTQGLDAYAGVVNANGRLVIDGGSLISERHAALWVRTAREVAVRNGARLIGGNGTLMAVDAAFASPFELSLDQDIHAQGDIVITPEDIAAGVPVVADIRVRLNGRSHWVGASSVVNQVALSDDSRWTLTGDASVGQLSLQDSTLALSAGASTTFNRLTVSGNVETSNALLIFNGALGDDTSRIDFLHVRGDTRGSAGIQVNNVHGLGGQTINGIQLIQVDGQSDAVYTLNGRAVAGSYDYFLHKGVATTPGGGGWYLRSSLSPTPPDPCDLDPGGPGCAEPPPPPPEPCDLDPAGPGCVGPVPEPCEADPSGPGCGIVLPDPCEAAEGDADCNRPQPPQIVRPEAGAYLANQAAAVFLFQHRLQDRDGADAMAGARGDGWLRVNSSHTRQDVAGQLALTGRASVLMGGMDVLHWGGASRGRAGVLLAAGQSSTDVQSQLSGYTATGTVKGAALGIYATWLQRPDEGTGAYADGWVQHGRYRNTVQGIGLAKERQDAQTRAASLETGYTWVLRTRSGAHLMVQPQLQVIHTDYRADRLTELNGTQVVTAAAGGLSSRVGIRLSGDVRSEDRRVQPFIAAHWLHDGGGNRIWMDDALIVGAVSKNRYEVRGGAMLQLGKRWSAWGDLGLQRGDGGYRSASAQLGLKASW